MKIIFRSAELRDVPQLVSLEKDIWGKEGADEGKIESRIKTFPNGSIVAELGLEILGYQSFEYVGDVISGPCFTWSEITDQGTIKRSHKDGGDFGYGINLTVGRKAQGIGLGEALSIHAVSRVTEDNKRGSLLGSRMPGFRKYLEKNPGIDAESYMRLERNDAPRDPELRLYCALGFKIMKILPGYFPDPESLDFGVLLFLPNEFYGKKERFFVAQGMREEAQSMLKMEARSWE
ncbi:MAG: hypothetical protein ACD_15C00082G0002 [uncultured bacterium]|nr:MAG: hypothetical protein ACD_15C00082G0002 [uncultured bacterium]HCU70486.1 hypothetical protein [Candidatus Moranbacteria bacterium]